MLEHLDDSICILGLGYVGLPLAVLFASRYDVFGFDINQKRLSDLKEGIDKTGEICLEDFHSVKKTLRFISNIRDASSCTTFIVTVPTPVDSHNNPNLIPLKEASALIGKVLKKGDLIVYESTVYPGCTEEECVPIIEKNSGLIYNIDFFCGYSPERINPGDKDHTVKNIKKITSGSSHDAANRVDRLYQSVIDAGTYKASSIKIAEAAKVIENTQRDINIAFVNELSLIFNLMGIDTLEVLEAAGTKWNFLPFRPGLVGGHCIGVDPYYLTYKSESLGYNPQVILAGRRINDSIGFHIAQRTIKLMIKKGHKINDSNVLVLGITFKENCSDIRNSKAIDIIHELTDFGCLVDIYDPRADLTEVSQEYNIQCLNELESNKKKYNAIVLAVAHDEFLTLRITDYLSKNGVIYDVKSVLDKSIVNERL